MSIQTFSFRLPSLPKIICSIPVILIALFFLFPLGVILLIARLFIYGSYKYYRVPSIILFFALIALAPKAYEFLQQNFPNNIPVIQPLVDFRSMPLYENVFNFGKNTTIACVIMLIISPIISKIANLTSSALSLTSFFGRGIQEMRQEQAKEKEERDRLNKIKNEAKSKKEGELEAELEAKQKTPHVIKCPNCGHSNKTVGTIVTCQYCNTHLELPKDSL